MADLPAKQDEHWLKRVFKLGSYIQAASGWVKAWSAVASLVGGAVVFAAVSLWTSLPLVSQVLLAAAAVFAWFLVIVGIVIRVRRWHRERKKPPPDPPFLNLGVALMIVDDETTPSDVWLIGVDITNCSETRVSLRFEWQFMMLPGTPRLAAAPEVFFTSKRPTTRSRLKDAREEKALNLEAFEGANFNLVCRGMDILTPDSRCRVMLRIIDTVSRRVEHLTIPTYYRKSRG